MNPIVKILITADTFLFFGAGLISPIFAVYITLHLAHGSLTAAGIAATVAVTTKAVLQIPIAKFTDREPAQLREFWCLLIGYFFMALVPFLYLIIKDVKGLYLVQVLNGVGAACSYPGLMSIFTKFADHEHAGFSWSAYSTSVLVSTALAGTLGGYVADKYGFTPLFLGMGLVSFLAFFSNIGLALFYRELSLVGRPRQTSFGQRFGEMRRRSEPPK